MDMNSLVVYEVVCKFCVSCLCCFDGQCTHTDCFIQKGITVSSSLENATLNPLARKVRSLGKGLSHPPANSSHPRNYHYKQEFGQA